MAHLFDAHGFTLHNPDDEDFEGYAGWFALTTALDEVIPLLTTEELATFTSAFNVHLAQVNPHTTIKAIGGGQYEYFDTYEPESTGSEAWAAGDE